MPLQNGETWIGLELERVNLMTSSAKGPADANVFAATSCVLYLILAFTGVVWLLFDTWIGAHTLAASMGYDVSRLASRQYQIAVNAIAGGAIGGIVNGIRSALGYCTSFDGRYAGKYISAPWMGAALALVALALLTTTAAVIGGQAATAPTSSPQLLSNFAIGALAGYGSRDVFVWLDAQVQRLFAVEASTPNVTGQPEAVAISRIQAQNLTVGAVAAVPASQPAVVGTVVDQAPSPGTQVSRGDTVDFTVCRPPNDAPHALLEVGSNGHQPHE